MNRGGLAQKYHQQEWNLHLSPIFWVEHFLDGQTTRIKYPISPVLINLVSTIET